LGVESEFIVALKRKVANFSRDGFNEPDTKGAWASYGDFQLVGNGEVTNAKCGSFSAWFGCDRLDLHKVITLGGQNMSNMAYVIKVHHSCDKPACPVCYKYGWAVGQALSVEGRLKQASDKLHMKVEHIAVSFPIEDSGLSDKQFRLKAKKVLYQRGVVGGCMVFHGFRYANRKEARRKHIMVGWYWSPHMHVLGFIRDGYGCRNCRFLRHGKTTSVFCGNEGFCEGFEQLTRRCFEKDKCIVKVLGERNTVGGTAWYELNHATVVKGVKRFHVLTWFGVCSYRKLKTVPVKHDLGVCPICQHEVKRLRYFGSRHFVLDRDNPLYRRKMFLDAFEDGVLVWSEYQEGSGRYR
jgi:hypothetical protein